MSLFHCYGNTNVNQIYFFDKFIQSLVNVWSSLCHQAQMVKYGPFKVGFVCLRKIKMSPLKRRWPIYGVYGQVQWHVYCTILQIPEPDASILSISIDREASYMAAVNNQVSSENKYFIC